MNNCSALNLLLLMLVFFVACKKDKTSTESPAIEMEFPQVVELPDVVTESSGILRSEPQYLWTHNDSGDEPRLYQIGLEQPEQTKILFISGATHKDWEAITQDEQHVYIGDIGNNEGSRTDLVIYKVLKSDLLLEDSGAAAAISFNYPDQTDFEPSSKHNFDSEALISLADQLFLFTKNRGNLKTHIYTLPKTPGTYTATAYDTFDVDGLITAAAINASENLVCLLGYNIEGNAFHPFIWLLYDFPADDFLGGKKKRVDFSLQKQTEGLCFKNETELYFTSEREDGEAAFVYLFDSAPWTN